MANYKYKARDKDGLSITGELDVENENILASKLEAMGYILISANAAGENPLETDVFKIFRKVKLKQLVEFSVQLSTLINAGVPLLGALDIMEDQQEDAFFKSILFNVKRDISAGFSFSESLAKHPKAFSKLYVSMIRAGEATGELDKILSNLALFLESENTNRNKVKSAMMYPLAMFSVSLIVVIFLITKVLPSFVGIFKTAGIQLPLPTKIVLAISDFIIKDWIMMIILTGVIWYSIYIYINTEKGRYYFDLLKFKIPVFGPLIKKSIIARFSRTLGTLIESSVPILQSLDIVRETVGNVPVSAVIDNIRNHVKQGGAISEQITLSGLFPKMVPKMIMIGESSGTVDTMLLKVADFYDSEVENEIKGLTSVLEPIMIVGMGLVIGLIVLSVMLPMFDMMKIARR